MELVIPQTCKAKHAEGLLLAGTRSSRRGLQLGFASFNCRWGITVLNGIETSLFQGFQGLLLRLGRLITFEAFLIYVFATLLNRNAFLRHHTMVAEGLDTRAPLKVGAAKIKQGALRMH